MVAAGLGISFHRRLIPRDWKVEIVELPLDPPQYLSLGIAVPTLRALARCESLCQIHGGENPGISSGVRWSALLCAHSQTCFVCCGQSKRVI